MATTSLQTTLIIRVNEEDYEILEGISSYLHIPVKDLLHGVISNALKRDLESKTTTLNRPAA